MGCAPVRWTEVRDGAGGVADKALYFAGSTVRETGGQRTLRRLSLTMVAHRRTAAAEAGERRATGEMWTGPKAEGGLRGCVASRAAKRRTTAANQAVARGRRTSSTLQLRAGFQAREASTNRNETQRQTNVGWPRGDAVQQRLAHPVVFGRRRWRQPL